MRIEALGQSCPALAALAGIRLDDGTKVLLAPLPSDLVGARGPSARAREADARAGHRALALGRARDRRVRARHRARRAGPHVGRLRRGPRDRRALRGRDPHGPHPRQRADRGRRARRRLQRAGAHVLARLRHVGRLDDDGERQLPRAAQRQGRLPPPVAAAVVPRAAGDVLQHRRAGRAARGGGRTGAARDRRRHGGAGRARRGAAPARAGRRARVRGRRARAGGGGDPRRRRAPGGDGRRPRRGRGRRLGDRRRQGHAPALRASRADRAPSSRCRSWTRASGSRASRRIRTAPG